MRRIVPVSYALAAGLCVLAPYVATSRGVASSILPYLAGPLALASLALGLRAYVQPGRLWLDALVALLWSAGAVALSVYLSSPPLELGHLFVGMRIQTALSGVAAAGVAVTAAQVWQKPGHWAVTWTRGGALLGMSALLGYRSLAGLGLIPTTGSIEEISRSLRAAQLVLVGCSVAMLLSVLAPWILKAGLGRRPTSA
jgi:hypothetical protein